jgi:hypothetical protein
MSTPSGELQGSEPRHYALCGEGLRIGYDGGDAVSSEYKAKFPFSVDVERELAAVMLGTEGRNGNNI